jgi:hypothetical protein
MYRGIIPLHSSTLSPHIRQVKHERGVGKDMNSQRNKLDGPARSYISHLDLNVSFRASDKTGFLHSYFVAGEDDKAAIHFFYLLLLLTFSFLPFSYSTSIAVQLSKVWLVHVQEHNH